MSRRNTSSKIDLIADFVNGAFGGVAGLCAASILIGAYATAVASFVAATPVA